MKPRFPIVARRSAPSRMWLSVIVLALAIPALAGAQGTQGAQAPGTQAPGTAPVSAAYVSGGMQVRGSQAIILQAGVQVPLFILPESAGATESYPLGVGSGFGLSYHYFLANRISLGASFIGSFNGTVGGRSLFVAPISARGAYWWGRAPMEYNVSLDLGGTVMRLSGNGMLTPFAKAGMGAYYQMNGTWSLGGQAYWWFVPEIHRAPDEALTRYGNIAEISLAAIYHL